MPLYKSATPETVSHGRFAINQMTGVYLAEPHAELDELVVQGLLVKEADEVAAPVAQVEAPKAAVDSPVAPTV